MYLQVYRNDGPYPVGGAGDAWPFFKYLSSKGRVTGFVTNGPKWKHSRVGMQPDILSPQAAQSYLPLINPAVRTASLAFGDYLHDVHGFATRASFDMFTGAMVGRSVATLSANAREEDVEFVERVVRLFRVFGELLLSPVETKLQKYKYK